MMRVLSLPTALQFVVFRVGDRRWDAGFGDRIIKGVESVLRDRSRTSSAPRRGSRSLVVSRDSSHP